MKKINLFNFKIDPKANSILEANYMYERRIFQMAKKEKEIEKKETPAEENVINKSGSPEIKTE